MAKKWISDETWPKELDFRGILGMHAPVCKGIMRRNASWADPSYLYADLYAGPGNLEFGGRKFLGSPLIAQEILTRVGLRHEAVHFEQDPEVASRLAQALWTPTSLVDSPDADTAPIFVGACQDEFPRWLEASGIQRGRFGLVYADPIDDEIPHKLLNMAARYLPRVDLLSYVAATQYKRRRGGDLKRNGHSDRPLLSDHVNAVAKKHALIREPRRANQYTFILWSDWGELPEWRGRGFYRLDSPDGARILELLDLTAAEHHKRSNTPLPFEEVPYRTYREYLRHPKFLKIRTEVFARADGKCERCRQRPPTEPHHLRYPPWGTFDVPENMIAVCHPCHCDIHGKAA